MTATTLPTKILVTVVFDTALSSVQLLAARDDGAPGHPADLLMVTNVVGGLSRSVFRQQRQTGRRGAHPRSKVQEEAQQERAPTDQRNASAGPVRQEDVADGAASRSKLFGERGRRANLVIRGEDRRLADDQRPGDERARCGRWRSPSHSVRMIAPATEAKNAVWIALMPSTAAGRQRRGIRATTGLVSAPLQYGRRATRCMVNLPEPIPRRSTRLNGVPFCVEPDFAGDPSIAKCHGLPNTVPFGGRRRCLRHCHFSSTGTILIGASHGRRDLACGRRRADAARGGDSTTARRHEYESPRHGRLEARGDR